MNARPYSMVIEILRFTLRRVEKNLLAHPDDAKLVELKRTLERRLATLEGRPVTDESQGEDEPA
jgi:hypothetical protein